MENENTPYQDLKDALIAAFDAYTKSTHGREMKDREIAIVTRMAGNVSYEIDRDANR